MALTVSEMLATTLQAQSEEVADLVMASNAISVKLKKNVVKKSGGFEIRVPARYQGSTLQMFSYWEKLNTTSPEAVTTFQYDWKQGAVPVGVSGQEQRMNGGSREQLLDLVAERVDGAKAKLANGIASQFRSDGTGNGGKDFTGLAALVATTATTGSPGGIDRSVYSWAQNRTYDFSSSLGAACSAATVEDGLLGAWMPSNRGADKPDLILAGQTLFKAYHQALRSMAVLTNPSSDLAKAGFKALDFMGADVVLDEAYGDDAYSVLGYMLNTKYLKLYAHRDLYFSKLGEDRIPQDQDGVIMYWGIMGNLTDAAPNFHTVITA